MERGKVGTGLGKGQNQPGSRWQAYIWIAPAAYRLLAFAIATALMLLLPSTFPLVIPPLILAASVGIYSLVKVWQPPRWYQGGVLCFASLGIDIAICIFLIVSSGGLYSPFLLYTLAPLLTAAIFLDTKVTTSIAGLSIAYVVSSHLYNPFYPISFSLDGLSYFLFYLVAACLTAALPYLTNVNLRQRQQAQDILRERQRLAGEIHDGIAQTLSALRWQAQLLGHHLARMGMSLDEVTQLHKLAEQAYQDVRESLELLHNYAADGNLLHHLQKYLERLKGDANINFQLDVPTTELGIGPSAEFELLRICQEALTNIRKHSGAHNVQVKLSSADNHLELSIADDGCGFDANYHEGQEAKGHGLAVMQERAEAIGGRLEVLSSLGKGTEVKLELPLPHRGRLWMQ